MRKIHIDYIHIFTGGLHHVSEAETDLLGKNLGEDEKIAIIARAIYDRIWEKRKILENDRNMIRIESQVYVSRLSILEVKRFFVAICDYFVLDEGVGYIWGHPADRDYFIQSLAERGGDSVYPTPSTRLLRAIKSRTSREEIVNDLHHLINALNRRYFNVLSCYEEINNQYHFM